MPNQLHGPSVWQESAQAVAMQAVLGPQWLVVGHEVACDWAGLLEGRPFNQGHILCCVISMGGTGYPNGAQWGPDVPMSHCLNCPRISLLISTLHAVV